MPASRREHLLRLRDPADRTASLAGLALLLACARAAGLTPPVLAELGWPAQGKPCWPGGPDFSISHGAGRVGCALIVPAGRVGLDLEAATATQWRSLRHVLAPTEQTRRGTAEEATALWVAKEAVVKAAGATLADAAAVEVDSGGAQFSGRAWRLQRPALAPGVACAVASDVAATLVTAVEDAARLLARGP